MVDNSPFNDKNILTFFALKLTNTDLKIGSIAMTVWLSIAAPKVKGPILHPISKYVKKM